MPTSTIRTPRFFQLHRIDDAALADEAAAGLLQPAAQVPPKFFYDALGSRLFDAITELAEYYPTRTEAAIFAAHGAAIAASALRSVGPAPLMIDLGAADCAKAARLFPLLQPGRYVAVDISVEFLRQAMGCLQREHPQMDLTGVGLDFSARLQLAEEITGPGAALVFYPGSSIGNFAPADALRLLREARALSHGGALLIGVDTIKDAGTLEAAYDDALGVTAAFNLNLLMHLNRLLGADFDVRQWQHVARFDAAASRIEMHLEARQDLLVSWPGRQRRFAAGERIHTENSYKWTPQGFGELLRHAGFGQVGHWTDERGWFAVFMASG
ncbi:MAG: L-histidine N(alpha)-methyltransferase [Piscinibacter sp.]|uniref:L-histidine N(alpha)-methyltransferase n=1 Tax=Piscinibacter sp. TaxID=1903157 RepID=UPI003D0F52CB